MTKTICACGLVKVLTPGPIAQCTHCDVPCLDRAGCPRCKAFTLETRKRTDTEYAREKKRA